MKRYTKSIKSNITPPTHAHTLGLDCFIDESYPLFKNQITSMLTNCLWAWHKLNDTSERAVCFKTPSSVCETIDANTQQVNILRTEQAVQFDSVWKEKHIKDKLGLALWTQRSRSEKPSVSGDHTLSVGVRKPVIWRLEEPSRTMENVLHFLSTVGAVTLLYAHIKTRTVRLKWMHFIIYKLYFDKVG